jgi:hypothetical protein
LGDHFLGWMEVQRNDVLGVIAFGLLLTFVGWNIIIRLMKETGSVGTGISKLPVATG